MHSKVDFTWQEAIDAARQGDTKAFNDQVCRAYQQQHKKALIPLVGSEAESWQIYLLAVTKFWEKYILSAEELPQRNIDGYIFMMCKNAYYDDCRKRTTTKSKRIVLVEDFNLPQNSKQIPQADDSLEEQLFAGNSADGKWQIHLSLLSAAIERMCGACKSIIEENVLGKIKLIDLKEKMNYGGGYQAIVQKKKRCLNKLTKLFYQELNRMSYGKYER